MDPAFAIQSLFITLAAGIILVNSLSSLRTRFIAYGARQSSNPATPSAAGLSRPGNSNNSQAPKYNPLDIFESIRVPHFWFVHFYVVSVVSSSFWALQIATDGRLFRILASSQAQTGFASMRSGQIVLTWTLMTIQGARRLYESRVYMKPSQSKMWIGHWAMGLVFYSVMGVAVWIEGSRMTLPQSPQEIADAFPASLLTDERTLPLRLVQPPSLRTFIGLPLFLVSSGIQHDCHGYLASLPKYSIPKHPAFKLVLCPHYTAECLIYLSLAIIAGPPGFVVNRTILAAVGFTVVNLGITARSTRTWYLQRFGEDSIGDVKALVPFLY